MTTILPSQPSVRTSPMEHAKALRQIIRRNPNLSIQDLGKKICKTESWIKDRLSLLNLDPEIQKLVHDGTLCLSNAFVLAKLKPEDQVRYLEDAMTKSPVFFTKYFKEQKVKIGKPTD